MSYCTRCVAHSLSLRPFEMPGDKPRWAPPRTWDDASLRLEVALDVPARSLRAVATLQARRVDPEADALVLDAIDFQIDSVHALDPDGDEGSARPTAFEYDGERLTIPVTRGAAQVRVRVTYAASPARGLYFVTRRAPRAPRLDSELATEVWSQGQDEDNRHWFPCFDHPGQRMRTEMIVIVPSEWTAISNGVRLERREVEGGVRFHYRQDDPHPSYLVTLACARFDEAQTSAGDVPVGYYVPLGEGGHIERSLGRTPAMIEHFAKTIGTPFPWVKYDQVVVSDFIFGGMENTSATTLYDRILLDERAALDVDGDSLVAHELAHQWFGDLVTCRDWSHAWLNEGFATFMEHVWRERAEGLDAYHYGLEEDLDLYLDEEGERYRRAIVTNVFSAPLDIFDRHLYQKGGLVLHALRSHLGDGLFWKGVNLYLERHRGRGVETRDLLRAMEDASGRSLEAFFSRWVMTPGHPALTVSAEYEAARGILSVKVAQVVADAEPLFELTLPVRVVDKNGATSRHTISLSSRSESFALRVAAAPKLVLVDERFTVPGTVKLELSTALLTEQLGRGGKDDDVGAFCRWRAARALSKKDEPRSILALERGLASDPFYGVRAECATALGALRRGRGALETAISDPDARVRRVVARALGRFREAAATERLLEWMSRGDPSWLVEAELRRAFGATRDPRALAELRRRFESDPVGWGDSLRAGIIDGLSATRDPEALDVFIAALDVREASNVRRAAASALAKLPATTSDPVAIRRAREALEETLRTWDPGVRTFAVRALALLGDGAASAALRRAASADSDPRVKRTAREAERTLRARAKQPTTSALSDRVDELETELRMLRGKVAALTPEGS